VLVGVFDARRGLVSSDRLALYPAIARLLSRYSTRLVPFCLNQLRYFYLAGKWNDQLVEEWNEARLLYVKCLLSSFGSKKPS